MLWLSWRAEDRPEGLSLLWRAEDRAEINSRASFLGVHQVKKDRPLSPQDFPEKTKRKGSGGEWVGKGERGKIRQLPGKDSPALVSDNMASASTQARSCTYKTHVVLCAKPRPLVGLGASDAKCNPMASRTLLPVKSYFKTLGIALGSNSDRG